MLIGAILEMAVDALDAGAGAGGPPDADALPPGALGGCVGIFLYVRMLRFVDRSLKKLEWR